MKTNISVYLLLYEISNVFRKVCVKGEPYHIVLCSSDTAAFNALISLMVINLYGIV